MYPPFLQPDTQIRLAQKWLAAGREARRATLESSRLSGAAGSIANERRNDHQALDPEGPRRDPAARRSRLS